MLFSKLSDGYEWRDAQTALGKGPFSSAECEALLRFVSSPSPSSSTPMDFQEIGEEDALSVDDHSDPLLRLRRAVITASGISKEGIQDLRKISIVLLHNIFSTKIALRSEPLIPSLHREGLPPLWPHPLRVPRSPVRLRVGLAPAQQAIPLLRLSEGLLLPGLHGRRLLPDRLLP